MESTICLAAGSCQIGRMLLSRPSSGTEGLAPSPAPCTPCIVSQDFPAHRNEFPVPDYRELVSTTAKRLGNLSAGSGRRVQFRKTSLYFPCRSGISAERRVRHRLAPPPFSLRAQRLPARGPGEPEKSPGGLLMQAARLLSVLRRAAHGRYCRPPGRLRAARGSDPPMGGDAPVSASLPVRLRRPAHEEVLRAFLRSLFAELRRCCWRPVTERSFETDSVTRGWVRRSKATKEVRFA